MTAIQRIEPVARSSRAVIYNGMVWLAGQTATDRSNDIKGQTREVLEKIEGFLAKAGTDKTRILSAQIWLKNIKDDFAGMNEIWDAWIPQGNAPARATGESNLAAPGILVEIIITAAV